jgi:predicted alpha/beta hydrolase
METITIEAADNYSLEAIQMKPVGETTGYIIINAATGVRKEFYLSFAAYLVQNGYAVLLYDYRGIGGSAPADLRTLAATAMHEWATKDMNAVLDYALHQKGWSNIIWIGHSVGAQLMGILHSQQHIKKVLAINCSTGYWAYFVFPYNYLVLVLWTAGLITARIKGYAPMHWFGWGEPLPAGVYYEWRTWCFSKYHFKKFLVQHSGKSVFDNFRAPITAIYTSDDYIANDKTVPALLSFYPHAPQRILKINIADYNEKKVRHTGIFRKRFQKNLWPLIMEAIEK